MARPPRTHRLPDMSFPPGELLAQALDDLDSTLSASRSCLFASPRQACATAARREAPRSPSASSTSRASPQSSAPASAASACACLPSPRSPAPKPVHLEVEGLQPVGPSCSRPRPRSAPLHLVRRGTVRRRRDGTGRGRRGGSTRAAASAPPGHSLLAKAGSGRQRQRRARARQQSQRPASRAAGQTASGRIVRVAPPASAGARAPAARLQPAGREVGRPSPARRAPPPRAAPAAASGPA